MFVRYDNYSGMRTRFCTLFEQFCVVKLFLRVDTNLLDRNEALQSSVATVIAEIC